MDKNKADSTFSTEVMEIKRVTSRRRSMTPKTTARLSVQVEEGITPKGRPAHRSFSIPKMKINAEEELLRSVVDSLRPVVAFPIIGAKLIVQKTRWYGSRNYAWKTTKTKRH